MEKRTLLILLVILSLLPLVSLFNSGLPLTHDGPDHVARIANFYQSLSEGNIIPRWAGNLNWGYGHPILMFLYPLPSYVASVFHGLGFSFVDSTKLVFGLTYVLSIIIFFLWANEAWNPLGGFIGAVIYGFSPYRFVDFYVRGDIGESMAFMFPPLIFWGLLKLVQGRNRFGPLVLAFGVFGLMTSHNAIALMALPIAGLYALYLGVYKAKTRRTFWISSTVSVLLGLLTSAFFWIPAFFEGKYTLRDILTRGDFSQRFVPIIQFFYSPWNYGIGTDLTKELGILTWVTIAGALFILIRIKKQETRVFILGTLGIIIISMFIMTDWSLFLWNKISLLQKFQFPWRFLTVPVIVGAVLGSLVGSEINKRFSRITIAVVLLVTILSTYIMWRPVSYIYHPESFYSGIYNSTTDTGESSPIWSVRFMEHRPAAALEVISGSAEILNLSRNTTRHVYKIAANEDSRILENTLYFPGWRVLIDGNEVQTEFQDPNYRGLMTFLVPRGQHTITIEFTDTKLRKLADSLSILGWTATIVLLGISLWRKKQKFR